MIPSCIDPTYCESDPPLPQIHNVDYTLPPRGSLRYEDDETIGYTCQDESKLISRKILGYHRVLFFTSANSSWMSMFNSSILMLVDIDYWCHWSLASAKILSVSYRHRLISNFLATEYPRLYLRYEDDKMIAYTCRDKSEFNRPWGLNMSILTIETVNSFLNVETSSYSWSRINLDLGQPVNILKSPDQRFTSTKSRQIDLHKYLDVLKVSILSWLCSRIDLNLNWYQLSR